MVRREQSILPPAKVGDSVLIPILELDRGRGDPANMLAVVLEVGDKKHVVGTKYGRLNTKLERNALEPI